MKNPNLSNRKQKHSRILRKREREPPKGGLVVNYEKSKKGEHISVLDDDVHTLIIGATRSGKTRSLVIQSIIMQALAGESIICSDPKGELYQYTFPLLLRLGYEVVALDFKNSLKSSRYNFLQPVIRAIINNNIPLAVELAWDMAEALVGEVKGNSEPIWNAGEKAIIAGSILAVVADNKECPQFQNMTNVYYFILEMCKTDGNKKLPLSKYVESLSDDHIAKGVFGSAEVAPSRTRSSFFTSALTTLRLFTSPNIYTQTCRSDFTLEDCGTKKQAVFIILPDGKTTYYSLASLFIYQHYISISEVADRRGGRLLRRVNYNLDEFGNFTTIPNFATFLTVAAGRGIRFNLFVQSFNQLDEKYGDKVAGTIRDNAHFWLYLKTSCGNTAKMISERLGNYTTSSYSRSSSYSGGTVNKSFNASNSMNLIARPLLTPDEITRLERPNIIVMPSGQFPMMAHLPDLSVWQFNNLLGLGDPEQNRQIRLYRENNRLSMYPEKMALWGIWKEFNGDDVVADETDNASPVQGDDDGLMNKHFKQSFAEHTQENNRQERNKNYETQKRTTKMEE